MKTKAFGLALLVALLSLHARAQLPPPAGGALRQVIRFDDGWRFHRGGAQSAEQPAFDASRWRSVDLPQPYESGMTPIGPGTRRVPVRFYLIAVLFILFDIEVVFFFPWAVVFPQLGLFGLVEMLIFIVILLVGYFYAWKKGALEWE